MLQFESNAHCAARPRPGETSRVRDRSHSQMAAAHDPRISEIFYYFEQHTTIASGRGRSAHDQAIVMTRARSLAPPGPIEGAGRRLGASPGSRSSVTAQRLTGRRMVGPGIIARGAVGTPTRSRRRSPGPAGAGPVAPRPPTRCHDSCRALRTVSPCGRRSRSTPQERVPRRRAA